MVLSAKSTSRLRKHYDKNIAVVFDGYGNLWSTRVCEHMWPYFTTASEIDFDENTEIYPIKRGKFRKLNRHTDDKIDSGRF